MKTYTCTVCGATKTEEVPAKGTSQGGNQDTGNQDDKDQDAGNQDGEDQDNENQPEAPQLGKTYSDDKNQAEYKVTKAGETGGTVEYTRPVNKNISKVTIPPTVTISGITYKITGISKSAFKNNTKLTTVKMGTSIKTVGAGAFYGCTKLKTVTVGTNVTAIGDKAFYKCTALTKIIIPSKVSKIGKQAFYGCKKLKIYP